MSTRLSPEHVAAIDRERRVVVNFDAFPSMMHLPSIDVEHMKAALFEFIDDPQTPIDSVWQRGAWNHPQTLLRRSPRTSVRGFPQESGTTLQPDMHL